MVLGDYCIMKVNCIIFSVQNGPLLLGIWLQIFVNYSVNNRNVYLSKRRIFVFVRTIPKMSNVFIQNHDVKYIVDFPEAMFTPRPVIHL